MIHTLAGILLTVAGNPATVVVPHLIPLSPVRVTSHITEVDTGSAPEPAPVLLTEDVIKSYITVRKEFKDFWKAHQPLKDSAAAAITTVNLTVQGPGVPEKADTSREFNYVDLAARHPDIAAVFTKNHLKPEQFAPVTVAVWKALFAVGASQASGEPVTDDAASMSGKNIALVKGHVGDFTGIGMQYQFQGGGGGGGMGGGDDDLNP